MRDSADNMELERADQTLPKVLYAVLSKKKTQKVGEKSAFSFGNPYKSKHFYFLEDIGLLIYFEEKKVAHHLTKTAKSLVSGFLFTQNLSSVSTTHKGYTDRIVLTRDDTMCVLGCANQDLKNLWGSALVSAQKSPKST